MEIQKGKLTEPVAAVVYGVEGVGKSTFASLWPRPVFVDVENSTTRLDVSRVAPTNWTGLKQTLNGLQKDHKAEFDTVVIDTADWSEKLCVRELCAKHNLSALGGQDDYGHSYNLLEAEFGGLLNQLTGMVKAGWNVLILAHAKMRTTQQPDEFGAYDRWELKLEKKTSALLKEWPEMLLFLNYKVIVVEDNKTKVKKGTGGRRVAYASHNPCWDAKNRFGLPEEFGFEMENGKHEGWEAIKHLFGPVKKVVPTAETPENVVPMRQDPAVTEQRAEVQELLKAMEEHGIAWAQLLKVLVAKGHYPTGTPITSLDDDYILGRLIPALPNIAAAIKKGVAQ